MYTWTLSRFSLVTDIINSMIMFILLFGAI